MKISYWECCESREFYGICPNISRRSPRNGHLGDVLIKKFSGKSPDHISTTLKETVMMKTMFPNIYTALCILGTIPITTCTMLRNGSMD